VTGASGYLGSHVISELLSRGYSVIATVRDKGSQGADYLEQMKSLNYPGTLKIIQADFTRPGSYDDALSESDYLILTAANTTLGFSSKSDILEGNVSDNIIATKNIIESIERSSRIKRIIYTSSMAAVLRSDVKDNYVYDENDWNNDEREGSDPYFYSKTRAEQMFVERYKNLTNGHGPELIRFNPSVIMGPFDVLSHQNTSISILRNLLKSSASGCPRLYYSIVDVRDLASVYVDALRNKSASGRYLIPGVSISLLGIAQIISRYFPEYKMPKRELKDAIVHSLTGHNTGLTTEYLDKFLGVEHQFNDGKLQRDFDRDYIPLEQTIKDSVSSIQLFESKSAEK
jgi:nucleoside-diphosphate-sugar epimerase